MKNSERFIYIHGGPGLNSKPEEVLLAPYFKEKSKEIIFWNEPINFSSDNYYQEIKESVLSLILKQDVKVHLLGHSFGAYIILDLLEEIPDKVESMTFLSPAVDLVNADKRIIDLGYSIHKDKNPEIVAQMDKLIPLINDECDQNKLDCLLLAFQSGYFTQNFSSLESFEKYFSHLSGDFEFRLNDYLKIKPSVTPLKKNIKKSKIKAFSFFGKNDPLFKMETEVPVLDPYFENLEVIELENVSHYPHIDAREETFNTIFSNLK